MRRLPVASLVSALFLLALCLRSLADASPLSSPLFLGHPLWTYKASIPLGCFSASLLITLWGVGAALLRLIPQLRAERWLSGFARTAVTSALPLLMCCAFLAPEACCPYVHQAAAVGYLQEYGPLLAVLLLLHGSAVWGLLQFAQLHQRPTPALWRLGLGFLLLIGSVFSMIWVNIASLGDYYPAWPLGLSTWVSYGASLAILTLQGALLVIIKRYAI